MQLLGVPGRIHSKEDGRATIGRGRVNTQQGRRQGNNWESQEEYTARKTTGQLLGEPGGIHSKEDDRATIGRASKLWP